MAVTNDDIRRARAIIYGAKLDDITRGTLYELVQNDIESFVRSGFAVYLNLKIETQHYAELKNLIDTCKDNSYFRGVADAVSSYTFSDFTQPYFSGWQLGYRSGVRVNPNV